MDKNVLEGLFQVIKERQESPQAGSYTCYLFEQGIDRNRLHLRQLFFNCEKTSRHTDPMVAVADFLVNFSQQRFFPDYSVRHAAKHFLYLIKIYPLHDPLPVLRHNMYTWAYNCPYGKNA